MNDASVELLGVSVGFPLRRGSISLKSTLVGKKATSLDDWGMTLRGINVSARAGDRIGIVGRNGAGKTTLLKVIAGIFPPLEGSRHVSGRIAPVIAQGIGFDPVLSVRANIRLGLLHSDRLDDMSDELEHEILDFTELEAQADKPLAVLSSGMRSRLSFSVSMFQSPEILLLDEIFATGDAGFIRKAQALTLSRVADVPILFFVSHSDDHIRMVCSRCILIDGGNILDDGPTESILTQYGRLI